MSSIQNIPKKVMCNNADDGVDYKHYYDNFILPRVMMTLHGIWIVGDVWIEYERSDSWREPVSHDARDSLPHK